jgi:hypothetical protein
MHGGRTRLMDQDKTDASDLLHSCAATVHLARDLNLMKINYFMSHVFCNTVFFLYLLISQPW